MQEGIASYLSKVAVQANKDDKVRMIRSGGEPFKYILRLAFDPGAKFALPEGPTPYKKSEFDKQEGMLFQELRRLYLFLEPSCGGNPNLKPQKRENLWIELLESLTPADAELLDAMKDKKLPWKGITKKDVLAAYPGLF
jgi:hypothetical protein